VLNINTYVEDILKLKVIACYALVMTLLCLMLESMVKVS